MTLLEVVAIVNLEKEQLPIVPSSLEDMELVNEKDYCRFAQKNYFDSDSYTQDVIGILDDLLKGSPNVNPSDFSLMFAKDSNSNLHLELAIKS